MKNTNTLLAVCTLALVAIAGNMTFVNFQGRIASRADQLEEKVFPVIGRTTVAFDGLGVDTGFLVQDGQSLRLVRYDQGSMLGGMEQPKFLAVSVSTKGEMSGITPIFVDKF